MNELQKITTKEAILEQTKNNILIEESYHELWEQLTPKQCVTLNDIQDANLRLWKYLDGLAEVQGIELPEYQG